MSVIMKYFFFFSFSLFFRNNNFFSYLSFLLKLSFLFLFYSYYSYYSYYSNYSNYSYYSDSYCIIVLIINNANKQIAQQKIQMRKKNGIQFDNTQMKKFYLNLEFLDILTKDQKWRERGHGFLVLLLNRRKRKRRMNVLLGERGFFIFFFLYLFLLFLLFLLFFAFYFILFFYLFIYLFILDKNKKKKSFQMNKIK